MRLALLLLVAALVAWLLRPRRQPVRWERVEPLRNTSGLLPSPDPYVLVLYQRRGMGTGGNAERTVWA